MSISGTGGEIARGFYYRALRGRRSSARAIAVERVVAKATRATGPARACLRQEVFRGLEPRRVAAELVREFATQSRAGSSHGILDDFYLRGRMQRFAGRNVTTTGLFCRQALPYLSNAFVDAALALPRNEKAGGRAVRRLLHEVSPELAAVPLDTGASARVRSLRHPTDILRDADALARKMARRTPVARRAVARAPETVPWNAVRTSERFEEFVRDLLLSGDRATADLLSREQVQALVGSALGGASLYPLGLVLTLELTMRRLRRGTSPAA